jgi:hypothetical protein
MDILTRAEREPLARLEGTTPPSIPKTLTGHTTRRATMTRKKSKETTFHNVPVAVSKYAIQTLLVSAFEGGGAGYWLHGYEYRMGSGYTKGDFQPGGRFNKDGEWSSARYLVPFVPGCALACQVKDEDTGEVTSHELTVRSMERGLELMVAQARPHFISLVEENTDATTADVFLQLALFGEVRFS